MTETKDLKERIAGIIRRATLKEMDDLSTPFIRSDILAQAVIDALGGDRGGVVHAGVRSGEDADGDEQWDIECRFENGEKYSAVSVVAEKEELAHAIANFLSGENK